jgi:CRP-like cAMP-binding protein
MAIAADMIAAMRQKVDLSAAEARHIKTVPERRQLKKGERWLEAGQVCRHIGFLQSGLLRIYYHDPAGNEVTCHFFTAGQFFSSHISYVSELPTRENIEALEDSEILQTEKSAMTQLAREIPAVQQYMQSEIDQLLVDMEARIQYLQTASAEQRYRTLLAEKPELFLAVPLQSLASFLGITPQHLSRLRRAM